VVDVHQLASEWRVALDQLNRSGWDARLLGMGGPIQVEGRVPSGENFYFRARFDEILLSIGGEDPSDSAPWEAVLSYGEDPFGASYLSASEGIHILVALYDKWSLTGPSGRHCLNELES
jgi:hypothetical protein